MEKRRVLCIGLAGASCSGKTSLARLLQEKYPHSIVIHQDKFYLSDSSVKRIEGMCNWDVVESLNTKELVRAVKEACVQPCTLCRECNNSSGTSEVHLIIVEGTMILAVDDVNDILDISFFLTLDKATCYQRRVHRQYDGEPDPPSYFEACLWPAYQLMYDIATSHKSVMLDGTARPPLTQSTVQSQIDQLL